MGRSGAASTSKTHAKPAAKSLTQEFDSKIEKSLKDVHKAVNKVADGQDETEKCMQTIRKLHDKTADVLTETQMTSQMKSRIRASYRGALAQTQDEAVRIRECLASIRQCRKLRHEKRVALRAEAMQTEDHKPMRRGDLMVMLQSHAATLPLWTGELHQAPPPLCGAIPQSSTYECPPGDACAALVRNTDAESSDDEFNWILGEVSEVNAAGKYRVDDVDEELPETHLLPKSRVIALPHYRGSTTTDPMAIFPVDAVVLALYPQTTCFYKGVIEQRPIDATDDYLVAFADKAFVTGYSPPLPVPQRYVVKYKNGK